MELTPELLLGMLVLMVLVFLSLVVFLIRAFRKSGPAEKAPSESSSESVPEEAEVVEEPFIDIAPAAEEIASPEPAAVELSPAPSTPVLQRPEPVSEPDVLLLMQVWQDREGFLIVEVDGQRYRRLFDIRDGGVGRRVLQTIKRLVAFSKGQESRVAPSPPPPEAAPVPTTVAPEPAPPASPTESEGIVEERERAFLEQLQQPEAQPKKSRFTLEPIPLRRSSAGGQLGITLNLADEIDQLLQIRLEASPEYRTRRIRVTTAPDGGLRFEVDGIRYAALDEIPERKVQGLIRAAINDWEVKR